MGAWRAFHMRLRALLLAGAAGAATAPPAIAQDDPATQAWDAARSADSVDAYQQFLDQYPDAPSADLAFRALIERSLAAGRAPVRGVPVDMY